MAWVLIVTARHAADLLASSFGEGGDEKLVLLYLDETRKLIGLDEYPGLADETELPFRQIFAAALRRDAFGMVIAHNHPSGDPMPSQADIEATRRLALAAEALDIRLHDHLIFAGAECRSFRELGLL